MPYGTGGRGWGRGGCQPVKHSPLLVTFPIASITRHIFNLVSKR